VTIDNNWSDNCYSGIVDGLFWPNGFLGDKCCTQSRPIINEYSYSWINIDMGAQTMVKTVLLISRED
jgi:hypothetical protein